MTAAAGLLGRQRLPAAAIPWRALLGVALASFAVCALVDLLYFGRATISGDEDRFLRSAAHLAATGEFRVGPDIAWEMPGTATFFALVMHLSGGSDLVAIRLAQAVLVALQAVLVGALATTVFQDRRAGLCAGAIAGFYPYVVFTQGLALSETLFNTLLLAGFLGLYRWRLRGARIDLLMVLALGVLVLATLTKATLTVLPPFLLAAAALGLHGLAATAKILGVALALYCLAMAPWWVRNYAELGVFVPFTTSAPINLYMGNSPRNPAVASYEPHLPADWAVDESGRDMRAIKDELERARAFRDRALAYIAADPADFVRRAAVKFLTFWNIFPNAALYQSPVYRLVGLLSFGPVLLLAIASFFLARTNLLLLLPFLLLALYMTALHVVTIASIRYRLPLEPLMIALAGAPLAALSRRFPVTSLPFGLSAR